MVRRLKGLALWKKKTREKGDRHRESLPAICKMPWPGKATREEEEDVSNQGNIRYFSGV